ncbi:MAG: hypothetical protein MUF54_01245 [Polyangiaceae bacterium]|jgi:hypothetical protein|nr:hypothetical protein [Polyangiaceae bacterium]
MSAPRRTILPLRSLLVSLAVCGSTFAQTPTSGAPTASLSRPVPARSAVATPAASTAPDASPELPPGHPPIANASSPGMRSLAARFSRAIPNTAVDDTSLGPGFILVDVLDADNLPMPSDQVQITSWEGTERQREKRFEHAVTASPQGTASVRVPEGARRWFHQAVVKHKNVPYASPLFTLEEGVGKRVRVHVYDVVNDIDAALVGSQAFVFVVPGDHGLAIDQLLRFSNLGDRTWRCDGLTLTLPDGFTALEAEDGEPLAWEEVPNRGVHLTGFVPPGTTELKLRYQVPYPGVEARRLHIHLPARTAHLRVLAAIPSTMSLRVDALPPPVARRDENGMRLMIAERAVPPGGEQIEMATVVIGGLPIRSAERWYALLLAGAAILVGVASALRHRYGHAGHPSPAQLAAARRALLQELTQVERKRCSGKLDAQACDAQREALLDQLSAVLAREDTAEKRSASQPAAHSGC